MEQADLVSRLRLRHLQAFVAVAEERHVGRAASRLHLTQPAVSKTLAELEDIVGSRLVDRGRRGAMLTRQGEVFLPHAHAVVEALRRAGDVLAIDAPPADVVRIGALPSVAPDLLPAVVGAFRDQRPQTRVVLHTATNAALLHQLTTGVIDVVVGRMSDPSSMAGVTFEWLYSDPLAVAVRRGHPLLSAGVTVDQVLQYPLVISTAGTVPRHNTESYLRARGLNLPPHCLETLSVSVARQVVQQSDAAWFVPAGAIRDDVARGLLARVPLAMAGTEEPVGLLRRSDGDLSMATLDLMARLREAALSRV